MKPYLKDYVCRFCEKRGVKLWRPYGDDAPLICASCAEKLQAPVEYDEVIWYKDLGRNVYTGSHTGKKVRLPKWKVNSKGQVPSYEGPGPKELPRAMETTLIVDLSSVSKLYSSGSTSMIPAIPDEKGLFYTNAPEEAVKWWRELPTRLQTIFAIWTTDDERTGSIKAYCLTKEIAERELKKYKDWYCFKPPKPDNEHIREISLIIE